MSRPNLQKAIQMCGSAQSLSKALKKYEKIGVVKAIEIANTVAKWGCQGLKAAQVCLHR